LEEAFFFLSGVDEETNCKLNRFHKLIFVYILFFMLRWVRNFKQLQVLLSCDLWIYVLVLCLRCWIPVLRLSWLLFIVILNPSCGVIRLFPFIFAFFIQFFCQDVWVFFVLSCEMIVSLWNIGSFVHSNTV